MMVRLLFLFAFLLAPAIALAVPLVADSSTHKIEIYSGFTGTQLLLFGARNDPGDIVIVMRGPEANFIVRKKERTAGMWINRAQERFDHVPHYYSIASSRDVDHIKQEGLFETLQIFNPAINIGNPFQQALRQILAQERLYDREVGSIHFMGETLFKATFSFPDNMPRGTYTAEIYLFSDGGIAGVQTVPIQVYKTGFDAFLYDAAHRHKFLYGIISVLIALTVGWFASWMFQRI